MAFLHRGAETHSLGVAVVRLTAIPRSCAEHRAPGLYTVQECRFFPASYMPSMVILTVSSDLLLFDELKRRRNDG